MPNQSGPTSRTGKMASCMNNLQHGSTSKSLFLPGEKPQEFFTLLECAFTQFEPATEHDGELVYRCVHDHWVLIRRERAVDSFEGTLYQRSTDPAGWHPEDLNQMHLLERYKTSAARSHVRSLKTLQTVQKMARDEKSWQQLFETQKQKLAIHVERFELLKAKSTAQEEKKKAEEPPASEPFVSVRSTTPFNHQTLYIGYEGGVTTHYETTPTNEQMLGRLTETDFVTRIYNFLGVPPEYKHLITPDAYRSGNSTSVAWKLSYAEWSELIAKE